MSTQTSKQAKNTTKTQKAPLEGINPKQHIIEVVDTDDSTFLNSKRNSVITIFKTDNIFL